MQYLAVLLFTSKFFLFEISSFDLLDHINARVLAILWANGLTISVAARC